VVLRLVPPQTATTPIINNGRLPVLCSSGDYGTMSAFPHVHLRDSNSFSSLSTDWLMRTRDEKKLLLVEANLTLPLAGCFQPGLSSKWIDQALFASQRISTLTHQNKDETAIVTVFVGLGHPKVIGFLGSPNTTIYVDALSELAKTMFSMVDELVSVNKLEQEVGGTEDVEQESIQKDETEDEDETEPTESTTDIFESIGLLIRKGIHFSTSLMTSFVAILQSNERRRFIHVVSDNPNFVQWAAKVLVDYKIVWTNPLNTQEMEDYLQHQVPDVVSLVCCSSDEKTSSVLHSIVSSRENAKVVALMDKLWMQEVTREMIEHRPAAVRIVSAESLHKEIFHDVQTLLASGHSPEAIRDDIGEARFR
jgi:hypothetical protein